MMREVVAAKPGSAKAHYVYAEILAHDGKIALAAEEAQKARLLDPDVKFTDPEKFRSFEAALLQAQTAGDARRRSRAVAGAGRRRRRARRLLVRDPELGVAGRPGRDRVRALARLLAQPCSAGSGVAGVPGERLRCAPEAAAPGAAAARARPTGRATRRRAMRRSAAACSAPASPPLAASPPGCSRARCCTRHRRPAISIDDSSAQPGFFDSPDARQRGALAEPADRFRHRRRRLGRGREATPAAGPTAAAAGTETAGASAGAASVGRSPGAPAAACRAAR